MSIETPQSPTPTKEQLKKMAGAQNLQREPTPQPGSLHEGSNIKTGSSNIKSSQNLLLPGELDLKQLRSVRPISARAIPKALFTALLLSPIFLVAFVFVNGIKVPKKSPLVAANQSKAQAVEPEDATDETTILRRQLAQANAQLALTQRENRQASAALPQPTQNKSKKVARTRANPPRVVARTVAPVPLVQPLRPAPRVQPQLIVKPIPAPKTAEPFDPNEHLQQLASADVYGAAAVLEKSPLEEGENTASSALALAQEHSGEGTTPSALASAQTETPQPSSIAETGIENTVYYSDTQSTEVASSLKQGSRQSAQLTQQAASPTPPQPDPVLEAPLINGQPQHFFKGGTKAKAILATPLVLEQEQEYVTIVLSEPLVAADRSEVFPAGTQILAQLRSLKEEGIIQLVGVFALLEKGNALLKIELPDSAIQILAPSGKPLIVKAQNAQPKQRQGRHRSLLGSVARRAARSVESSSAFGSANSDLVAGLAQETADAAADAAVSELERGNNPTSKDKRSANMQYLAAGTEVGVFVTLPFSTPVTKEGQKRISSQPNSEPQLSIADDPSFQRSIAIFQLRNRLGEAAR